MTRRQTQHGSAMIVAVIVVIIVIGVGGAFLADTVYKTKTTSRAIDADEATIIAEATLEKTRRALYVYKRDNTWPWEQILAYCESFSTDGNSLYQQFNTSLFESSEFVSYRSGMNSSGAATKNEAPLPGDPDVFFGVTKPYSQGGANVVIRDNDDGDADPLVDSDLQLIVFVSSFLPDGTIRQIEALVQYESPTYEPDSAIIVDGTLLVKGNNSVLGLYGKVHANEDLFIQGSPVIAVSGNAVGNVDSGGVAAPPGGWNSGVPEVPIPDIVPSDHIALADYIMGADGKVYQAGNPVAIASGNWGAWKFISGTWKVSGNDATLAATYYVEGDFDASGIGASPPREWTVIATGSITTSGNVKYSPHYQNTLFLAGRDLKLNGTSGSTMVGFAGAHEQLMINGNLDYQGAIIAKDAEDLANVVTTGSALEEGGTSSGSGVVTYNGGLMTFLENPGSSVKIKNLRKVR